MTQALDKTVETETAGLSVLKKRRDFLRIARGRLKWVSKSMIVQIAATPEDERSSARHIRVGYTASKKVGNAVKRNRAKRRLRQVVRDLLPDHGQADHDYVLIARTVRDELPYDHLIRDFRWCLRRLKPEEPPNRPSGRKGGNTGRSSAGMALEGGKK